MADLFLDIRDRNIRTIVSDSGEIHFQRTYSLTTPQLGTRNQDDQASDRHILTSGELADIIATIRIDAGISLDQVHIIIPTEDVQCDTHRLPRMPQQEALKLLTRKIVEKSGDEAVQICLTPMAIEQNSQEWLSEYVPTDTLRSYKKEFAASKLKLKTVTTALDSTLHAIAHIRESIFNAHAVFEINATTIEAYYVSASSLLLHETLLIGDEEDLQSNQDAERGRKKRMFTILNLMYRVNSQYQSAHPMTPLQKVWLCGTDSTIADLSTTLQEAMDVETGLLSGEDNGGAVVLQGFWEAYLGNLVSSFMHPDLLRRFPLRKKTGMLVYVTTAILAISIIFTTEYRHRQLYKQAADEKKLLAAQKKTHSASANFVKNLELIKKLLGNQVMFYPVFRELAMSLPDGVFLNSFNYSSKDNRNTIDLTVTFLHSSDLGTQKTLTRLMEVMDGSPYLRRHREPSIIATTSEINKVMTVKFNCEVNPLDTAK